MWIWLFFFYLLPIGLPILVSLIAQRDKWRFGNFFGDGWLYLVVYLQLVTLTYDFVRGGVEGDSLLAVIALVSALGGIATLLYGFALNAVASRRPGWRRAAGSLVFAAFALTLIAVARSVLTLW